MYIYIRIIKRTLQRCRCTLIHGVSSSYPLLQLLLNPHLSKDNSNLMKAMEEELYYGKGQHLSTIHFLPKSPFSFEIPFSLYIFMENMVGYI